MPTRRQTDCPTPTYLHWGVNGDGKFDNRDLQGFLDFLKSGGGGSISTVPEPSTLVLAFLSMIGCYQLRRAAMANVGTAKYPCDRAVPGATELITLSSDNGRRSHTVKAPIMPG